MNAKTAPFRRDAPPSPRREGRLKLTALVAFCSHEPVIHCREAVRAAPFDFAQGAPL